MKDIEGIKNILTKTKEKLTELFPETTLARMKERLTQLESEMKKEGFWQKDQKEVTEITREAKELSEKVEKREKLLNKILENLELLKLFGDEISDEEANSMREEAERVQREVEEIEREELLSGKYDKRNAIITIHAGAGGTEAQDWVDMLFRMYARFVERKGWKLKVLSRTPGEEAGTKSITFLVEGNYAYGLLKGEKGVHRLVRISPFDANKRRHTSFALVEVLPEMEEVEVEINPSEIKMETFRSSSAGGQNVNKLDTAVRLIHIPTGIVVTCQTERSQLQNRENAMKMLMAKLFELKQKEQDEEVKKLKGEKVDIGWGNQIRSYVLHPYNMVKDLRTKLETGNTTAFLDGEIEDFLWGYLRAERERSENDSQKQQVQ
jgi:peptide chain release factor 2